MEHPLAPLTKHRRLEFSPHPKLDPMHELLLFGQVPAYRHDQVLGILAGVAAMQPQRVYRRHVLYRPAREPEPPGSHLKRGGTQTILSKDPKPSAPKELYITQLLQELTNEDLKSASVERTSEKPSLKATEKKPWTWKFTDVPEAGNRGGVLVRLTNETDIIEGDPHAYMVAQGNKFHDEYYVEGHQFIHGLIVILLWRILEVPRDRITNTSPQPGVLSFDALELQDPSGAYILEAQIRVQDLDNAAVSEHVVKEMTDFKDMMKGVVPLSAPDRLDFDFRIKYDPKRAGMALT